MNVTRPHKAENAELDALRFPAFVFPKVDGVRGLYITRKFTGRSLKPFKNSNITEVFSHPLLAGLDGELAVGDIRNPNQDLCRNTTSLVNTHSHNTFGQLPDWYVFDLVDETTAQLPFATRWATLNKYVESIKASNPGAFDFLKVMPEASLVHTADEVIAWHRYFLSMGYEGTIIRRTDAPHKNGRSTVRESFFMRLKEFVTEEAIIVSFSEAQANMNDAVQNELGLSSRSSHKANKFGKGAIGSLELLRDNGERILCGPGRLTAEEKVEFFHNPHKILGKVVTFSYMPYGTYKKPRFPQFENFRADEDMSL